MILKGHGIKVERGGEHKLLREVSQLLALCLLHLGDPLLLHRRRLFSLYNFSKEKIMI